MKNSLYRFYWWLLLVPLGLITGCASFQLSNKDYVFQEVYYLTTRQDTGSENPAKRYNGERGIPSMGVAMVAIDPDKALSSFAQAQPNHELHQEKKLRHRALQQIRKLPEKDFLASIRSFPRGPSDDPEALIYIHGYLKGFDDNVTNAAHLRYELAFPGPVFAFSWPSTNQLAGYVADIDNLMWSESQLRRLIGMIADQIPGVKIHVFAHSMGNRGLLEALSNIIISQPDFTQWSFGEIIFVAPDVDRGIFEESLAGRLNDMPFRKTLYVSSEDFPLMASAKVYHYPRLGDSRNGVPVIDGIETVDVSDVVNITSGHGYYEASRETIEDFYYLIREGRGAADRPNLLEVDSGPGKYWKLKAHD